MSFIDDLKAALEKADVNHADVQKVLYGIARRYGGTYAYIRKKEGKRKP